jgi:hypothetical protein
MADLLCRLHARGALPPVPPCNETKVYSTASGQYRGGNDEVFNYQKEGLVC